jgi:hypothetical protein
MNIATPQDICAECDIGWLATDRGDIVFQCNLTTFAHFFAGHIRAQQGIVDCLGNLLEGVFTVRH